MSVRVCVGCARVSCWPKLLSGYASACSCALYCCFWLLSGLSVAHHSVRFTCLTPSVSATCPQETLPAAIPFSKCSFKAHGNAVQLCPELCLDRQNDRMNHTSSRAPRRHNNQLPTDGGRRDCGAQVHGFKCVWDSHTSMSLTVAFALDKGLNHCPKLLLVCQGGYVTCALDGDGCPAWRPWHVARHHFFKSVRQQQV